MRYWNLPFHSAPFQLATDEALLHWLEECSDADLLVTWEPDVYFVVLGYGNQVAKETLPENLARDGIELYRRCSGGGTVVQGPGTLNYSLFLNLERHPECQTISGTNRYVMQRQARALAEGSGLISEVKGVTDLVLRGRKFSGNAQRRKRRYTLFHGSYLLNLDLSVLERWLCTPSREPDYRAGRTHSEFVMNLEIPPDQVIGGLIQEWEAHQPFDGIPADNIQKWVSERYGKREWNYKF